MDKIAPASCCAISKDKHSDFHDFPKINIERYQDPTPYAAVHNLEEEKTHANKLYRAIVSICELSGYHIQGKITVVNSRTGHRWML